MRPAEPFPLGRELSPPEFEIAYKAEILAGAKKQSIRNSNFKKRRRTQLRVKNHWVAKHHIFTVGESQNATFRSIVSMRALNSYLPDLLFRLQLLNLSGNVS